MNRTSILLGAALLLAPAVGYAQQTAAPAEQALPSAPAAPADLAAPPTTAPTDTVALPATDTPAAPVETASAADGVTKEGGKYLKDGRKATKVEIAAYKKAEKARSQ